MEKYYPCEGFSSPCEDMNCWCQGLCKDPQCFEFSGSEVLECILTHTGGTSAENLWKLVAIFSFLFTSYLPLVY